MLSLGRGLPDRQSFGAGVHSTQESLNACMGSCGIKVLLVYFPALAGAKCACSVGHSGSSSGFSGARLSYAQATLTSSSPARSDFMLRRGVPVFMGANMPRLSAPTQLVFFISLIIAVIALIGFFVPFLSVYAFWIAIVAYVVLALSCFMKGI